MSTPEWGATRGALRALTARPRPVNGPQNWFNGFRLFLDYVATVPPRMQRWTAPFRKYGAAFRKVHFRARDGAALAGWLGVAPANAHGPTGRGEPRDGLVLVPGLYTSKDNYRIRARAARILHDWGYHVLTLDLRGVGESQRVYSTPGWKEAEDLVDAVAFFREHANLRRVHVYTESLAASAAIIAAGAEARAGRRFVDGRVVAMSPHADASTIVRLYGTPDPGSTELGRDFVLVQRFFNGLLRLQGYKGGRFDAYSRDGARHYGVSIDELLARSSPERFVADVNVPLLVVHSEDDGLVPVAEARRLAARARENGNVDVWVLPWGYHCLYEMAEPDWYWRMLELAFDVPSDRTLANHGRATPSRGAIGSA